MFDPRKLLDDLLGSKVPGTETTVRDKAGQVGQLAKDNPLATGALVAVLLGTGAGQATISFAEALGDDVNGIFSSSYPPDINPDGLSARAQADLKEFKTRYVAKYKVEPAVQESLGFVVGLALMEDIIGNAKSTSPADLAAVAKTIDLPGGTYINGWGMKFDATGQNVMAEGAVVQWQDQRMVVVYPDSVSMAKPIMVPLLPPTRSWL